MCKLKLLLKIAVKVKITIVPKSSDGWFRQRASRFLGDAMA